MKNIPVRHLKNTQEEPHLIDNFVVKNLSTLLKTKDLVQGLHRHDYFFILALEKGSGTHEIDFIPYEIHDNAIFLMRPGQVHQLTLNAGSTGFILQFNQDFYYPSEKNSGQLLRKASNKNNCQLDDQRIKKLLTILNTIFQEYTEKQEGFYEIIKANLGIFFIELVRHRQNKSAPYKGETLYAQQRIEDLLTLIETNLATQKQVSAYASMLNLSTFQLNAITKTTLGKNCSELINDLIILESKRYLLATSNQVNQIAYHLGYEDVSYFIRFFKKHTGLSPEAFRNNFK
ncbi:MAG: helix-turn-helix domain-containing protein [Bacteroidia bacterium]|nr:helix-turn-helix domain-containing protein [Bacteroidia bacterium]